MQLKSKDYEFSDKEVVSCTVQKYCRITLNNIQEILNSTILLCLVILNSHNAIYVQI